MIRGAEGLQRVRLLAEGEGGVALELRDAIVRTAGEQQRARVGELAGRAGRFAWVACWCSSCSSCEIFIATAEYFLQRIARDAKKFTLYRPRRSCRCAPKSFTKAALFQGPPGGTVFRTTPPPRKVAVAIGCVWLHATAWRSTQDALTNEEDGRLKSNTA